MSPAPIGPVPRDPAHHEEKELEDEAAIEWQPYLYEDFKRHFHDASHRGMEKADGDEGAFVRNIIRLKHYFDEFYDAPHSIRNHGFFTVALSHLSCHAEDYDSENFGVSGENDSLWVSEALLRAVHWYFVVQPRTEWGSDALAVARIKERARAWIAANPDKRPRD